MARGAIEAAIDAQTEAHPSFIATIEAEGRQAGITPAQIAEREAARKAEAAENPALGTNQHPYFKFPTGAATPEGMEAARAHSSDGLNRG
jgi:hypothetical protein